MKTFIVEVAVHTEAQDSTIAMYDVAVALQNLKEDGIIKDYGIKFITEAWKDEE